MKTIRRLAFEVAGPPQGKGRPRFCRRGKFVQTYTPKATVNYESLIRHTFTEKYPGLEPWAGPVICQIWAYTPIPTSFSRIKKDEAILGITRPLTKPDLSNILKAVEDALNKVAFVDDNREVEIYLHRRYGITPRLRVELCFCQFGNLRKKGGTT